MSYKVFLKKLHKNFVNSKKSCNFALSNEKKIVLTIKRKGRIMARRLHCEHKNHLTAIGSSLRFIGAANDSRKSILMKAFNFPLHVCEVGNDIVAYYQEDFYEDDLRFMRENYGKALGCLLKRNNVVKNTRVLLARVLPETLPMHGNKTWEEIYERSLESTERDDSGTCYKSRKVGANYDKEEDKPAIVRTYSINEYRTNGYF